MGIQSVPTVCLAGGSLQSPGTCGSHGESLGLRGSWVALPGWGAGARGGALAPLAPQLQAAPPGRQGEVPPRSLCGRRRAGVKRPLTRTRCRPLMPPLYEVFGIPTPQQLDAPRQVLPGTSPAARALNNSYKNHVSPKLCDI